MKTITFPVVALLLTGIANRIVHAEPAAPPPLSKAVRVEVKMKDVYQWETPGKRIRFFVETGSVDVPLVCLADNAHFPTVTRYLARERRVEEKKGVLIDIYFQEPVSSDSHKKAALALNLWQPNLTAKKYPLHPTNGKKFIAAAQRAEKVNPPENRQPPAESLPIPPLANKR